MSRATRSLDPRGHDLDTRSRPQRHGRQQPLTAASSDGSPRGDLHPSRGCGCRARSGHGSSAASGLGGHRGRGRRGCRPRLGTGSPCAPSARAASPSRCRRSTPATLGRRSPTPCSPSKDAASTTWHGVPRQSAPRSTRPSPLPRETLAQLYGPGNLDVTITSPPRRCPAPWTGRVTSTRRRRTRASGWASISARPWTTATASGARSRTPPSAPSSVPSAEHAGEGATRGYAAGFPWRGKEPSGIPASVVGQSQPLTLRTTSVRLVASNRSTMFSMCLRTVASERPRSPGDLTVARAQRDPWEDLPLARGEVGHSLEFTLAT